MTKNKYFQLTLEQRYKIEIYVSEGKNQSEIAILLNVHKSTISRELSRNTPKRGKGAKIYDATKSQLKTTVRHHTKPKFIKLTDALKTDALNLMMNDRLSPELISATWKKNNADGVSHECLYNYIWLCKHSNQRIHASFKSAYKYLKHGKRKRKRGNYKDSRGLIPNRVSIEKRPDIVNKRKRSGDLEVDLIMGKNHKSALLVTVDRKTLLTSINKVQSKSSKNIASKIINRLKHYSNLKTLTFDNDLAFADHEKIAASLNVKTYFTRPYTSQDKGTIENRNGVIRLFYPKKTDFNLISHQHIKSTQHKINSRPIRKFGYLSAYEVSST